MSKLVFIAIPTKGTVKDGHLTHKFLSQLADFHHIWPDTTFIAPMVQDYQLLPFMSITATWEDWGKHCRVIIPRCDEVWVLKYTGWDKSIGVAGEIACAKQHDIPVFYHEPM